MRKKIPFTCTAQIVRVVDGDTVKLRLDLVNERGLPDAPQVDLGFRLYIETADGGPALATAQLAGLHLYHETSARLHNVLAPELPSAAGQRWMQVLAALLPPGTTVKVLSHRLDKYGRVEAELVRADGVNINAEMKKQTPG
jgi:endonuclease YncB( thermonuclease family)